MMALILPLHSHEQFVFGYLTRRNLNGRTIKRNIGRRRGVEVWWRMYLHHFDLYYRFLGIGLRQLLNTMNRILQDENPVKSCYHVTN